MNNKKCEKEKCKGTLISTKTVKEVEEDFNYYVCDTCKQEYWFPKILKDNNATQ